MSVKKPRLLISPSMRIILELTLKYVRVSLLVPSSYTASSHRSQPHFIPLHFNSSIYTLSHGAPPSFLLLARAPLSFGLETAEEVSIKWHGIVLTLLYPTGASRCTGNRSHFRPQCDRNINKKKKQKIADTNAKIRLWRDKTNAC